MFDVRCRESVPPKGHDKLMAVMFVVARLLCGVVLLMFVVVLCKHGHL